MMYGSGVNLQQCSKMIYLGIGFKFNDFIQGIHRIYRFLQQNKVEVEIIYTEAEEQVKEILLKKWDKHKETVENMTKIKEIVEVRKNQYVVYFFCDYCNNESSDRKSHYDRKKKHYCNKECYSKDRKENWKPSDQPTWKGGVTKYEAHRRYVKKNPERISHLKARRYAREKGAEGSHSLKEWTELCAKYNNRCISCRKEKKLTKDHIIPLSKGGTDYISNIQPMCRNCNSKKWNHIYENPELLEDNK